MGHRGQLQEVLLNLVQNSIDAMRTITDRSRVLSASGPSFTARRQLFISVEESGPGIEPKKIASIFDPFVTTKAKGMGLGLAISHMIIECHQGQISIVPSAKSGAHFRITLPIKAADLPA